ncbi:hypothetical protein ASF73_16065 [Xanthomonas sp. Leaf131]|nr:hypothetical protein ASF73_16065 [Xanthomonas sp. Leaf131]
MTISKPPHCEDFHEPLDHRRGDAINLHRAQFRSVFANIVGNGVGVTTVVILRVGRQFLELQGLMEAIKEITQRAPRALACTFLNDSVQF